MSAPLPFCPALAPIWLTLGDWHMLLTQIRDKDSETISETIEGSGDEVCDRHPRLRSSHHSTRVQPPHSHLQPLQTLRAVEMRFVKGTRSAARLSSAFSPLVTYCVPYAAALAAMSSPIICMCAHAGWSQR